MKQAHGKRLLVALCAAVAGGTALAADTADSDLKRMAVAPMTAAYVTREASAPAAIKARLESLRKANELANRTFTVGYTTAMDRPLSRLTGARAPRDLSARAEKQNAIALKLYSADNAAKNAFAELYPGHLIESKVSCSAGQGSFDWRSLGKVTAVRDQKCGNCWAYASMAAYESSYLIRNGLSVDTSEQYTVKCATYDDGTRAGTCKSGWHAGAFEYLISGGDVADSVDPDTGVDAPCKRVASPPYRAVAWGYVNAPAAPGFEDGIPSTADTKAALCEHGPLAAAVLVTDAFPAYTGGTFKESLPASTLFAKDTNGLQYHVINHDVTLIGWNDALHAWLIKNSWGTGWGETGGLGAERGYMWIDYDSNNIGLGAAWVHARNNLYTLPKSYFELLPHVRPFPDPAAIK